MSQCPCCGAVYPLDGLRCLKCGSPAGQPPNTLTPPLPKPGSAAQAIASAVQSCLPQSVGLRRCSRCQTTTPITQTPITKGEAYSTCMEKVLLAVLLVMSPFVHFMLPVSVLYFLYLYYRKVWVCPHCGARDTL